MDRIIDHTSPLEDEEQAFLIRQALAAAAIARARKEEGRFIPSDGKLEEVLSRVSPKAFTAFTVDAGNARELWEQIRKAGLEAGYTDEELEL